MGPKVFPTLVEKEGDSTPREEGEGRLKEGQGQEGNSQNSKIPDQAGADRLGNLRAPVAPDSLEVRRTHKEERGQS